jgi:hypothetical protein
MNQNDERERSSEDPPDREMEREAPPGAAHDAIVFPDAAATAHSAVPDQPAAAPECDGSVLR